MHALNDRLDLDLLVRVIVLLALYPTHRTYQTLGHKSTSTVVSATLTVQTFSS